MCGIAGILTDRKNETDSALNAMIDAQRHRGPDDHGVYQTVVDDLSLGLGHRRLSIIDVSAEGHQPMVDQESGAVIVYNGEIYNYRSLREDLVARGTPFHGESDTEVLLQGLIRWGAEFLQRLCGMFALAFYDPRSKQLLLARDPMGIKPLYVYNNNKHMVFASEIRAVLASGLVPRRTNRRAVAGLLAYGAVQEPDTIVHRVQSFPAGCFEWFNLSGGSVSSRGFQPLWKIPEPGVRTEDEFIEAYRSTLVQAVDEHLVSDVPLAVLLSAGIDSTVLAGIAARKASDLRTFTIGLADHPDLDEATIAERTARILNTRHTTVTITDQDCQGLVDNWLGALDQPSMDGLNVFLISNFIAQNDITVVISGLGGDEMFGGYPSFEDVPRFQRIHRLLRWLPRSVRSALALCATVGQSKTVRRKLTDIFRGDGDIISLCLARRRAMSDSQLCDLGLEAGKLGLDRNFVPREALEGIRNCRDNPLWMVSQIESRFYQGNMLLRDGDANGMAHSLEIRVPFLDRRIIDLAFSIPDIIKLPNRRADKHLTRLAFTPPLRPEVSERRKSGFHLPINRWMQGPLSQICDAGLQRLKQSELVETRGVEKVWNAFRANPEGTIWSRAWSLCVLGIYLQSHDLE